MDEDEEIRELEKMIAIANMKVQQRTMGNTTRANIINQQENSMIQMSAEREELKEEKEKLEERYANLQSNIAALSGLFEGVDLSRFEPQAQEATMDDNEVLGTGQEVDEPMDVDDGILEEVTTLPPNFDPLTIASRPELQRKSKKVFEATTDPSQYFIVIGHVIYKNKLYRNLKVPYFSYPQVYMRGTVSVRNTIVCPFSDCAMPMSNGELLSHIKRHFDVKLRCPFCIRRFVDKNDFSIHMKICRPDLLKKQASPLFDLINSHTLDFSDVHRFIRIIWESKKHVDIGSVEGLYGRPTAYLKWMPKFFKPIDFSKFDNFINKCLANDNITPNNSAIYQYVEVTIPVLSIEQCPENGCYTGSTNDYAYRILQQNSGDNTNFEKSNKFTVKLRAAKKQKRSFVRVKLIEGVKDTLRLDLENAVLKFIGALSKTVWNIYQVAQNETRLTSSWDYEDQVFLGMRIFMRFQDDILAAVNDESNVVEIN